MRYHVKRDYVYLLNTEHSPHKINSVSGGYMLLPSGMQNVACNTCSMYGSWQLLLLYISSDSELFLYRLYFKNVFFVH
jgi:hypothetical protein